MGWIYSTYTAVTDYGIPTIIFHLMPCPAATFKLYYELVKLGSLAQLARAPH
jgi:hypothetical protein